MLMRKMLNRVSMKTLGRLCSLAIVLPAVAAAEFWVWHNARGVFDGRSEMTYWFAPDGTVTCALHVEQKNWRDVPVGTVNSYDCMEYSRDQMAWYDEHGNELEWNAVSVGSPMWRYEAQLRTPVGSRQWVRYTTWIRKMNPAMIQHEGQNWGIYQEENGDWVFKNNSALGPENTVSMIFPANTEIISVEPARYATVVSEGGCPMVRFDDLREVHVVKWRMPKPEAPSEN